jgi:hypothetical protein
VNHAFKMGKRQGLADLEKMLQEVGEILGISDFMGLGIFGFGFGNQLFEGFSLDALHGVADPGFGHFETVDRHDVRMGQLGRDLHLTQKALMYFGIVALNAFVQLFIRHRALQAAIAHQMDRSHRPFAEHLQDFVMLFANGVGGGGGIFAHLSGGTEMPKFVHGQFKGICFFGFGFTHLGATFWLSSV